MRVLLTIGNAVYLLGVALEITALQFGVSTRIVAIGLGVYAVILWFRGYVR